MDIKGMWTSFLFIYRSQLFIYSSNPFFNASEFHRLIKPFGGICGEHIMSKQGGIRVKPTRNFSVRLYFFYNNIIPS